MAGTASRTWPKNSRQTVRVCAGILCSTQRAATIMPSVPSFCTPGTPPRNLSVTSLPRPTLRQAAPGSAKVSSPSFFLPVASKRVRRKRTVSCSWILPRLCSRRSTSSQLPSGVTIFHQARLSSAVPHSTAFFPPAFMAMLPPMQDASADVGSTAKTRPERSAASDTRLVTTPAPVRTVPTG